MTFPPDWETSPLQDCLSAIIDYRGKTPEKTSSGVPLITAKIVKNGRIEEPNEFIAEEDYDAWMTRGLPEPGDVVITTEAPLGEVAQLGNEKVALAQRIILLRGDKQRLDNTYLRYCLNAGYVQSQLHGRASGTTVTGIKQSELRRVEIALPPLEEQKRIAQTLRALDDKIELNRRMNATLEAMAQALFKSWFVDFDPVKAKAAGRAPAGMEADTAALFPSEFVESELGLIPKGWEVGSILTQAKLLSGGTPKTERPDYWNGNVKWASAKDVSQANQTFLIETERTITTKGLEESATQLIPALGTVVVARGATTGRMVLFGKEMAMNQTCYALVSSIGTPLALHCQLRRTIDVLVHAAHGSVFNTITTNTFSTSKTVLPSAETLQSFERIASPIFEKILTNTEECLSLATIRDALLPKLISGQLRIPEAEAMAEAAL
ncbi:MAG: restriction endonuclease subunit S [Blastocatellia bacterium]